MNNIVSVIVPCRNEISFIEKFFDNVFSQRLDGFEIEIIVADGVSDDGTLQYLQWLIRSQPRVKYLVNTGKIVSTGLNAALAIARGEYIVRMDVHTVYERNYIAECVKILKDNPAISCVGGAWVAKGNSSTQIAIAAAFQSPIGSGGASSRKVDYSGWVDTVYLGAWRRLELIQLGGFDEMLVRNQDDELSLRIIRNGGRIWQSSKIRSTYFPRASFFTLYRQFEQYGYWKIPVIRKHRMPASVRHIAPFLFYFMLAVLLILSMYRLFFGVIFVAVFFLYTFMIFNGTRIQRTEFDDSRIGYLTVFAVMTMHFGYAVGFAKAAWRYLIIRKDASAEMKKLTR